MKSKLLLLGIVAVFLLVGASPFALATSYYVSPSGSGTSCTSSSPCSLTTGLSKPNPGDQVVLMDGTYSGTMYIKRGGTSSAPVVVRAQNSRKAVIRNTGGPLGRVWANYVTVNGIVFDGGNTGGNKGAFRVGAGDETTLSTPVHHVIVENINVRNTRAAGISITSGEHDIIVRDSLIESTGHYEFWGEAFYLGSKYVPSEAVYNLEIYNNTARGFTENGAETKKYSHHVSIHDNVFYNQVRWADYGGDPSLYNDGTITLDGDSHTVYDNRLYNNNCGMAVFVVEPRAGIRVFNNVAYNGVGGATYAVRMKNWSSTYTAGQHPASQVYNNTFYKLLSTSVGTLDASILIVKNNIGLSLTGNLSPSQTTSTIFTSASAGDFHLVGGCAAIDKATTSPYASTDFDGKNASGSYRDFGAYEYYATAPPKAPSNLKVISVASN